MRVLLALAALAACDGDSGACGGPAGICLVDSQPAHDPLSGIGTVELVQAGFMFTEGPQWTGDKLLFSDIPANTIYQYANGTVSQFAMPSGNSNGLAYQDGALFAAEHGTRSVTKDSVAIASNFGDKKLNSPNDLIVVGDTVYFTDPPYGIQPNQSELDFVGVFRLSNGSLTPEHRGFLTARPNGIGISPDQHTLYVDDTDDGRLYAFPVNADGSLGTRVMLAMTAGGPDGLAVDEQGDIFVTSNAGIEVFSPTGMKWGTIAVPKKPTNCAFGDADHQTLFITAQDSLYKVRLAHPGLPNN